MKSGTWTKLENGRKTLAFFPTPQSSSSLRLWRGWSSLVVLELSFLACKRTRIILLLLLTYSFHLAIFSVRLDSVGSEIRLYLLGHLRPEICSLKPKKLNISYHHILGCVVLWARNCVKRTHKARLDAPRGGIHAIPYPKIKPQNRKFKYGIRFFYTNYAY